MEVDADAQYKDANEAGSRVPHEVLCERLCGKQARIFCSIVGLQEDWYVQRGIIVRCEGFRQAMMHDTLVLLGQQLILRYTTMYVIPKTVRPAHAPPTRMIVYSCTSMWSAWKPGL